MKKESISQKRIRIIADLCSSAKVPFVFGSPFFDSKVRKHFVIAYIGGYPWYYSLKSFLTCRSTVESVKIFSRVVISDIRV